MKWTKLQTKQKVSHPHKLKDKTRPNSHVHPPFYFNFRSKSSICPLIKQGQNNYFFLSTNTYTHISLIHTHPLINFNGMNETSPLSPHNYTQKEKLAHTTVCFVYILSSSSPLLWYESHLFYIKRNTPGRGRDKHAVYAGIISSLIKTLSFIFVLLITPSHFPLPLSFLPLFDKKSSLLENWNGNLKRRGLGGSGPSKKGSIQRTHTKGQEAEYDC